jgi:predicted flap endonuclease-1-like 5' DNA nuclease
MSEQSGKLSCTLWCFAVGGLAGALATVMLVILGDFGWNGAVFTGAVLALAVAAFLVFVLCRSLPTMAEVQARSAAVRPASLAHAAAAPAAAPAPEPAAEPAPTPHVAPVPDPEPAPAPAHSVTAVKPVFLSAARDSGPDDLKLIKGVGPKLEQMLHEMGVFHFDQIAAWTEAEVAWVDDHLEGFKGRVSRDDWVTQARALVSGSGT